MLPCLDEVYQGSAEQLSGSSQVRVYDSSPQDQNQSTPCDEIMRTNHYVENPPEI